MNIYVGNLSYETNEDDLRQLFEEFGAVSRATVINDRETGRSKGFGFVEMESQSDAESAIKALDGSAIGGRNLRINEARPRENKPRPQQDGW